MPQQIDSHSRSADLTGTAPSKRKPPAPPEARPAGKMAAARAAVRDFLTKEILAREIRVTKLGPDGDGGWEADAEILVLDLSVKSLGLELSQKILERYYCELSLDSSLCVTAYELTEHRA